MTVLHSLPPPESRERIDGSDVRASARGEVVALPFIRLETVLKTMKMLRQFPDQSVLDQFNRNRHVS